MGTKRVEGRTKKKSRKSKLTSRDNMDKRRSRMGKKIKKGMAGPSADFMTRSSVLKKLQITLKDFRRLCILKGIYPRVPEKAPKGSDKVYYDIKDVLYLSHEPLLHKFREFKAFMKKIRREAGRYQHAEARRKNDSKPVMKLDHLVKERYPRFVDALRDMDDCLSMIHLFAAMPSVGRITSEKTKSCQELVRHWQYYIARTRSLQKVFVSVKGIYFQAMILGEPITWLAPHQFAQTVPRDVDMRVMATFLEFYEVFLRFTLYKLYNMQGLHYPPKTDKVLHDAGCFLLSIKAVSIDGTALINDQKEENQIERIENIIPTKKKAIDSKTEERIASLMAKMDEIVDKVEEEEEDDDDEDGPSISGPLSETLQGLFPSNDGDDNEQDEVEKKTFATSSEATDKQQKLFSKFKFFINREVPLEWMQLCIISFGGQVGWEGPASPYGIDDAGITHHIVDRPIQGQQNKTREYIQPQWVFDCINAQILLPVQKYLPGAILPPHLSPFVDDKKEGYVPQYREEIQKLKSTVEVIKSAPDSNLNEQVNMNMKEEINDDEDEVDDEKYQRNVQKKKKSKETKKVVEKEEDESSTNQADAIQNTKKGTKGVVYKPDGKNQSEGEEVAELSHIMMSKKTKRLYDRMQHGIGKKQESTRRLEEKRQMLEQTNSTQSDKKRPLNEDKQVKNKKSKKEA